MNARQEYIWVVPSNFPYLQEIKWVVDVFADYCGVVIHLEEKVTADLNIEAGNGTMINLNHTWFDKIYGPQNDYMQWPDDDLNLVDEKGEKDYFATAFYFLNCLWEADPESKKDHWGRSDFDGSIWMKHRLDQPILKVNSVFDELANKVEINVVRRKASVFLSHDIDVVSRAHLEDGLYRLKNLQLFKLMKVIGDNLRKRQWFNFQKIADLEISFGYRSTFFWLPVKGEVQGVGKNADYEVSSQQIKQEIQVLSSKGFSHGVHKSLSSYSLKEEAAKMGIPVLANRYHYLKFNFSELIQEMGESALKIDASLGYAQVIGYRNGYSLPYRPFDLKNRLVSDFLEVPVTIMDGTLSKYMKLPAKEALDYLKEFLDKTSEQAVISVLWHNSHFTDHKYEGYPDLYRNLLSYFQERGNDYESIESLINRLK